MKRVLIITYYWPPNGGAGVQRWLKFVKYLPQNGWQPVVYTPSGPEIVALDEDLLRDVPTGVEVIKQPIVEPYGLYRKLTGRSSGEKVHTAFLSEKKRGGWREDVALWVRSNFFIPDARIGWVRPSVRFLRKYLEEHPVDVVVTTGPPHSMHLIGLALKRSLGVHWVADFRDPWTNIDFYRQLKLSTWADSRHRRLEREVLTQADTVLTIGWTLAAELKELGAKDVTVITNGYDPDDVPTLAAKVDNEFSLVHVGSLSATRNAPGLWGALGEECMRNKVFGERFKLRLVGPVDHTVLDSINASGLAGKVERIGQVPHAEAMREMQRARVLLLLLNDTDNAKGILTSKVFEYLAVGRPVLGIGPTDGDVARVLEAPHRLIERGSEMENIHHIKGLFDKHIMEHRTKGPYSRIALTANLAECLDAVR